MALELGLKVTRTRAPENATSVSELRISKNVAGPVFVSTETRASFILTCYLKGYERNSFQIKISEDGKEISISGEKPIQEMLMMGRVILKKNVEVVGFRKAFKIPSGVVLDRIKAKFDEDESLLKIVMPKLVKGICGVQIEEVKQEGFGESSQKASETGENESAFRKEEGLSDKKLVESTNGDVTADKIREEIESPRLEAMKKSEIGESADDIPKTIGKESPEVLKESVLQPFEESENIMLGRPPGTTKEEKFEGAPEEEIGELKVENGGKDEEQVRTEMSNERLEATETSKEGGEYEEVFAGKIVANGKDKVPEIEQGETEEPEFGKEDRGEQRVEDILEETQKEEIEETRSEREGKDEERGGAKVRKEGLEATDTAMEGREPEKILARKTGVSRKDKAAEIEQKDIEEPKFGAEDRNERRGKDMLERTQKKETEETKFECVCKDKESAGAKIGKEGLEAIDTRMEGREPEKVHVGAYGINGEDRIQGKQKKEIEEPKFKREGKDKERAETEISEDGLEGIDSTMEGREDEKVLDGAFEVRGEDELEKTQKKEIEETKFEREGKDKKGVGTEVSKGGLEGIDTAMEGKETEKVLVSAFEVHGEDKSEGTQKKEIEETRFECKGKEEERVGMEISKGVLETKETTIEGKESKNLLAKEIQETKFESEGKDEEREGREINKEALEVVDTTMKARESEKVLLGATGLDDQGRLDKDKQRKVEQAKLESETKGKEEGREERKTTKEELEVVETRMEGLEPKKVDGGKIEVSEEGVAEGIKQKEIEDKDKERVKDIVERTQKRDIQKLDSETRERGEERVGMATSKEGLEAIDTTKEGEKLDMMLAGSIGASGEDMVEETKQGESEATKYEIEGKEEAKVGTENDKKVLEAMEGGESKEVLVGKIGVSEEDMVEGTEQREIDEIKFEVDDKYKEKVEEVFKGEQEKEIGKKEFAIEGEDEERVRTKTKEELEAKITPIEGGVSEKLFSGANGASGKDTIEGTKKGEIYVRKFESESRYEEMLKEEISNEQFEASETRIKESPMQEPKLPIRSEEREGIERDEDKSEGAELKEIEEPKFHRVEDNSMIPKCATSKGENLEEIEKATEAMAKRRSQEAEGILEEVEGEESEMSEETSKINGNDDARDSRKKEVEESAIRFSRDGQHVQENTVNKAFGELGTDTAKFPKQLSGKKAQREKELKVKEEIIVKREKEVKVKEVIVHKYDETKEGFEKITTGDRVQLKTGQPSDEREFDEETLEAANGDKTKTLIEGSGETEPLFEKAKGDTNDNVQGALFSPLVEDNKRERTVKTQKETEDPRVGTKHKAQHRVEELPTKMVESIHEGDRPKDTKVEEMREAKRKSEETQVVADEESIIEGKSQEEEIKRIDKTNQFGKALREAPKAKEQKALGKDVQERESMMSTQQSEVKEIEKVWEECESSEANLEIEKWRTTEGVKDEKLRRENAVKQVAKSIQKSPEKEHPGKSEVEKEAKYPEAKVSPPKLRKEVEKKNEVEGSRLEDLPPPRVKVQSLGPLESDKRNMKWKFPKTKKPVLESREGEEYEAGKPPDVKSSPSTQQSEVNKKKFEIEFPKEIEALQPNVLSDQRLEGKEHFKTLNEDRGHYLLEKERRLETAEEEKQNKKDGEKTLSCERERTKIVECKDEKHKMKKNGSEKMDQITGVAEEFRDVLADNETEKSQETLLVRTAEIERKEKISEIREVQQEKRRKIPFHGNEESEEAISDREVESQKPHAAHPKESSIKFSSDKPKGELDKPQRKKLPSPSVENMSKGPSRTSRPGVKEDAPTVENFAQFQESKESTSSLEGTKASETVANELDRPPDEKLEEEEEGKIDECRDGEHLESQEPEKQESELDFQESTTRRSDQEDEETHLSQQEENHEGLAIEEEKAGEAADVSQVEISQESEDLEDIEVEESEKKVELRAPLVVAGSVFIASLIILFLGHKRAGRSLNRRRRWLTK
ncbi:microtubule-associated protein futsch isoform X2 [Neltuma alba]|uniref:microtubule-associated protein futsch isoform X2 n=1 Tax=Neltuma alba TaxID=207710 RepID=UPI0010A44101|nr:microtubule-associated protein futsch isoform X2 [Prosopis alba]